MPLKCLILFLSIFLFFSCAKTTEQEVASAIDEARYFLNSMSCSDALDVLDEVGFQSDNADFITTYASAQACRAGYTETGFLFGGNLALIDANNLLKSLASFPESEETTADSNNFIYIQEAIMTLLSYDGNSSPSTADRNSKFGTKKSGDMSMQALYMIFVNMGKFFYVYGNAGNDGTKGGDEQSHGNSCLFSYTNANAAAYINGGAPTGSCSAASGSEGSDFLEAPVTSALIKTRLCYGVILFTNMIDILENITLPGSSELGDTGNIGAVFSSSITTLGNAETSTFGTTSINTIKDITSQTACEALSLDDLERWYAIFFETSYI